jgi:co-chaperonin GroES (HSP10)
MNEVVLLTGIHLKENRVLVKKFDKLTKTASGIILPEEDHKAPDGGYVVAKGPTASACELGEKVRYLEHGKIVLIDNQEYYLIRDTDIWTTID